MTDEPQVALTTPPITHVWATTYESEFERKQRKVTCLRAEKGLAITECGYQVYTFTHIPTGKRFTDDLTDKQALATFDDVLDLTDWTLDTVSIPGPKLAVSLVALGLVTLVRK
jgi:hypothetical protein